MLSAGIDGFLLGASLIVAIGAQNAFVLRQGLRRTFVLSVCMACALSDAVLIMLGVGGLGRLISRSPDLIRWVSLGGAAFLFAYGLVAFRRAWRAGSSLSEAPDESAGWFATLAACLAFTFLNPHVYLDTLVLVGSLSARHQGSARAAFAIGATLASFAWFFSLGYGARLLSPVFARPNAWRVLDCGIGLTMWALGFALLAQTLL